MDKRRYTRRELLTALAAGGVLTASGLWMPGQKLISIPSGRIFTSSLNPIWALYDWFGPKFGPCDKESFAHAASIADELINEKPLNDKQLDKLKRWKAYPSDYLYEITEMVGAHLVDEVDSRGTIWKLI